VNTEPLLIVGVELGARMEDTAISVTERAYIPTGDRFNVVRYHHREGRERLEARETVTVEYRVRHLEKRTPPVRYKGVAERVAEIVGAAGRFVVAMDLTRRGRPVHALLMRAIHDTGVRVTRCPVSVTEESGAVSHSPGVGWLVPRRDLVVSTLLLFEQGQLEIAEGLDLAGTLTAEVAEFKPRAPKEELGGWRLGRNDDLVLAVAMSAWAAERFLRKEDSVTVGALGAA
jgi:hypothetical protein